VDSGGNRYPLGQEEPFPVHGFSVIKRSIAGLAVAAIAVAAGTVGTSPSAGAATPPAQSSQTGHGPGHAMAVNHFNCFAASGRIAFAKRHHARLQARLAKQEGLSAKAKAAGNTREAAYWSQQAKRTWSFMANHAGKHPKRSAHFNRLSGPKCHVTLPAAPALPTAPVVVPKVDPKAQSNVSTGQGASSIPGTTASPTPTPSPTTTTTPTDTPPGWALARPVLRGS
jgi:hypothetical protein